MLNFFGKDSHIIKFFLIKKKKGENYRREGRTPVLILKPLSKFSFSFFKQNKITYCRTHGPDMNFMQNL